MLWMRARSRSTSCRFHSDQMNSRSIEWFMVLLLWSERAPQSCVVRYGCRDLTLWNCTMQPCWKHRLRSSSDGPDEAAQMKAWSPGACMIGFPRTGWDSRRLGGRFSRRDLTFWGETRGVPLKIIVWALHNASSHVQSSASLMVAVWPTYWRFRRCFARCSRRPHHMHFCVSVAQFMVSETRVSNHCFGSVLSV